MMFIGKVNKEQVVNQTRKKKLDKKRKKKFSLHFFFKRAK